MHSHREKGSFLGTLTHWTGKYTCMYTLGMKGYPTQRGDI